jgi:hypothetical protein
MDTDRTLARLTAPDCLDGLDHADTARNRALRVESCRDGSTAVDELTGLDHR